MDEIPPAEAFEPQPDEVVGAGRLRRRIQVAVTLVLVAALVALAAIEGSGYIIRGDGIETTPPPASAPPGARLAAVDSAGALTTIDVSDGSVVSYPVPGVAFQFPAWSPDGSRIAAIGQAADGTGVYVFTARAAGTTATDPLVVYRSPDRPPFYLYWAPDSRLLTFLTTEPDGLALRIAPADAGASASVVRAGAPMYWDFVDSGRLLVHSGAPGPDAFLGEVGVDGGALQPSDASPGLFRAPAISGDGRYRAYVTGTGAATGEVVIETGDGSRVQRVRMFGPAALSFSSQGHELAFLAPSQATNRAVPVPIGPLRIVGTDPGEPRTLPGGNVVAFFWSPSGKEIAVLRLDTTDTNVTQASGRGGATLAAARVAPPRPLAWVTLVSVVSSRSTAISFPEGDQKNATTLPPGSVRGSPGSVPTIRSGPIGTGTARLVAWLGARNASS